MVITSYNNEFLIINNLPFRKKDVKVDYITDKVGFVNTVTNKLIGTPTKFSKININGVFYNDINALVLNLAEVLTTVTGGIQGIPGTPGTPGKSAYEIAVTNGYIGNEASWLLSLEGMDGANGNDGVDGIDGNDGIDGKSAYEIAVLNGYVGNEINWLASLQGTDGSDGIDGADGISAYQVAVNNGFIGTEAAWLLSLEGPAGNDGADGVDGVDGASGLNQMQIEGLI